MQPTPDPAWDETRRRLRGRLQGVPAARVGLPRTRWHNVQRVLQAVLWFDQKGEGCWAGAAALAEEADLSRSTLGRAKRDAHDLGLLTVRRRDNPGPYGGRLPDLLAVDLDTLGGLIAEEAPLSAHPAEPPAQPDEPSAQPGAYIKEQTPRSNSKQQPPQPTNAQQPDSNAPPNAPPSEAWRVVEGELFQLGVNQAAAAVRDARTAGLAPAEAHAIVDHWRPRRAAWGEHTHAVLRRRLGRASPGQPPGEGWPPYAADAPRADAVRADRRAADLRREQRRKRLAQAEGLIADLTPAQRAALGAEARRRTPELAKPGVPGRRVFEEGVAPLLAEWGAAGLRKWLDGAG